MTCEARTQLLNELSRAVSAYNRVVNQMINRNISPPELREQAEQAREACYTCRAALQEHERRHGCSIFQAGQQRVGPLKHIA
jgi:predicted ATP-grasp superfamily ATP-dependent carboligase